MSENNKKSRIMVSLKCDGCGRIVEAPEDYDPTATCKVCGKLFTEIEDIKEENKKSSTGLELITWESDDCDDYDEYDYLTICKDCIDKAYPRAKNIVYKEKIVEKPVMKYIEKNDISSEQVEPIQEKKQDSVFKNVF